MEMVRRSREAWEAPVPAWGLVSSGWKLYHSSFVTDGEEEMENTKKENTGSVLQAQN